MEICLEMDVANVDVYMETWRVHNRKTLLVSNLCAELITNQGFVWWTSQIFFQVKFIFVRPAENDVPIFFE